MDASSTPNSSIDLRAARPARRIAIALILALGSLGPAGCSSDESGESTSSGSDATTGGESAGTSGETTGPIGPPPEERMPSTTLIPVPLAGAPRETLSAELQEIWRLAEEGSALVRPDYEGELTNEAMAPWVQGEFMGWAQERGEVSQRAASLAGVLEPGSVEIGVAGGLVGYSYEEFVIAFRGVPVPNDIAEDPELLAVYLDGLTTASQPYARQAAAAYGACARTLAPLGPESPWIEWAAYCLQRAEEVNEVYGLDGG